MVGRRCGQLVVVRKAPKQGPGAWWECRCDCGGTKIAQGVNLRQGRLASCGCLRKPHGEAGSATKGPDGKYRRGTPRYELWRGAKARARELGVPFNLDLDDIVIPEVCPALGTPLKISTNGQPSPNSPSLDRFIPELGYVQGNVEVISYRANSIKRDATLGEMQAVLRYLENLCGTPTGTDDL